MSKALQTLREALYATGLVQPLNATSHGKGVSVICRQLPGYEKPWLQVVDRLLEAAEAAGHDIHICRRYVRKEGRMVFGWHLGVEAKNAKTLVEVVDLLVPILKMGQELSVAPPEAIPVQKHRSAYQDRTPDSIKKGLEAEGTPVGTTAPRRAPEFVGPDPEAPPEIKTHLTVVQRGRDTKGKPTTIEEMPLPHVYQELNKPKPGSIKGAKGITET